MKTTCGWDELKYLEFVRSKLPEKPILYDVGFNRGDFTIEWLQRFPNSVVHGFEPIKELFELSKERFKFNKNVKLHNFGLHNKSKSATIYFLQKGFDGMSSIHYRPKYYPKFEYVEQIILLKRFDEAPAGYPAPDFIKVDTEGNEFFVLLGMESLLKSYPPKFIQVEYGECYEDSKTTLKQLIEYVNGLKYEVYNREFNLITTDNVLENYDLQNYLCVLTEA